MAAAAEKKLGKVDAHYGYRLGVDGFVSRRQVAEKFGYTLEAVDGFLAAGSLRWLKLPNGRVRVCKRSLDELISRCEQTPVNV